MSEQSGSPLQRPSTRAARHSMIEYALAHYVITSQQQLSDVLAEQGVEVTQATLSRDLDEMHAAKVRRPDGTTAYATPSMADEIVQRVVADGKSEAQMGRILNGLLTSAAAARNLVVVHTPSGAAQYVASVIDRYAIDGVLGTIAGDDTVLIIAQDDAIAADRADWLLSLASRS
ncbi:arginine repressor [Bifidobacterium avesanii]|uniref:Arginine repressor n=1 Tax=Bifidobacterium avesanii TaxID=1798157 RepID=A0A7K3TEQ1_9BIFI|nr:arginine repressor [Bifidobacterium avesanii]KAB8295557.1 arginine repressor [Bifidobacterium avesanii]NEG77561.1 arginine repressor [Bifidobacterium avesanii]